MDQQREEHLWELINIARGQGNMGLLPMVLNLLEQGETFDTEDLLYLQQRLGEGGGGCIGRTIPEIAAQDTPLQADPALRPRSGSA